MNFAVDQFVGRILEQYPIQGRVLEVGSLDICGSIRHWFIEPKANGYPYPGSPELWGPTERFPEYIGIDHRAGNLVDVVMEGREIATRFGFKSFDIVISTSALEHDPKFWFTIEQIYNVLKPGGWFILTVPSYRNEPPHDQHDYWRFLFEGIESLVTNAGLKIIELIDNVASNDILCLTQKLHE